MITNQKNNAGDENISWMKMNWIKYEKSSPTKKNDKMKRI